MSLSMDKFKGDRSKHFKDPMHCFYLTTKTERSGNKTQHWKCWWYDKAGNRKFASFALAKYGHREALSRCIHKLRSKRKERNNG